MNSLKIAPVALYQQVAERLRQRIFSHDLPPDTWLDEQTLADQYGISRTPLREALKVLASEGLVTLKPRRGCYVNEVSERDLDEVYEIVALLEGQGIRLVTQLLKPADLVLLEQIHRQAEKNVDQGDIAGFFETNQGFHQQLQQIAANRWLQQTIGDLRKVIRLSRHQAMKSEGRLQQSLSEHRAILDALRAGNADAAERQMREHVSNGRAALVRVAAARDRTA